MVGVHRSRSDERIPKLQILYPNPAAEENIGIPQGQVHLKSFHLHSFARKEEYYWKRIQKIHQWSLLMKIHHNTCTKKIPDLKIHRCKRTKKIHH